YPLTTDTYTLSLHDALPISSRGVLPEGGLPVARERAAGNEARHERSDLPRVHARKTADPQAPGRLPPEGRRELPPARVPRRLPRSEEHTSELQSRGHLVCRL